MSTFLVREHCTTNEAFRQHGKIPKYRAHQLLKILE